MASLASLPGEVIAEITEYLEVLEFSYLWRTGDSKIVSSLLQNATRLTLVKRDGRLFSWPNSALHRFSRLHNLRVRFIRPLIYLYIKDVSLTSLPPTLTRLELRFFNAFLAFLEKPPSIDRRQATPISSDDEPYRSDLATILPNLTTLIVEGGTVPENEFFNTLPPSLTQLTAHVIFLLPRTLELYFLQLNRVHWPPNLLFLDCNIPLTLFEDATAVLPLPAHLTSLSMHFSLHNIPLERLGLPKSLKSLIFTDIFYGTVIVVDCVYLPPLLQRLHLMSPNLVLESCELLPKSLTDVKIVSQNNGPVFKCSPSSRITSSTTPSEDTGEVHYDILTVMHELGIPLQHLQILGTQHLDFASISRFASTLKTARFFTAHNILLGGFEFPRNLTHLELNSPQIPVPIWAALYPLLPESLVHLKVNNYANEASIHALQRLTRLETLHISGFSKSGPDFDSKLLAFLPRSLRYFRSAVALFEPSTSFEALPPTLTALHVSASDLPGESRLLQTLPRSLRLLNVPFLLGSMSTQVTKHLSQLVALNLTMSGKTGVATETCAFLQHFKALKSLNMDLGSGIVTKALIASLPRSLLVVCFFSSHSTMLNDSDLASVPPRCTRLRLPESPYVTTNYVNFLPPSVFAFYHNNSREQSTFWRPTSARWREPGSEEFLDETCTQ